MGRKTAVSVAHRRALNQAIIYVSRAPVQVCVKPQVFVRALRSALRMTQRQLARRSCVPQAHIARLEAGKDARVSTLKRLFNAMFCDLLVLPKPRQRLGDVLATRRLERKPGCETWDD